MNNKHFMWLSVFGFMFLWGYAAYKILRMKDLYAWFRLVGIVFKSTLGYIMLPMIAFVVILHIFATPSEFINTLTSFVLTLYLYGMGVYVTYKLHLWINENVW